MTPGEMLRVLSSAVEQSDFVTFTLSYILYLTLFTQFIACRCHT